MPRVQAPPQNPAPSRSTAAAKPAPAPASYGPKLTPDDFKKAKPAGMRNDFESSYRGETVTQMTDLAWQRIFPKSYEQVKGLPYQQKWDALKKLAVELESQVGPQKDYFKLVTVGQQFENQYLKLPATPPAKPPPPPPAKPTYQPIPPARGTKLTPRDAAAAKPTYAGTGSAYRGETVSQMGDLAWKSIFPKLTARASPLVYEERYKLIQNFAKELEKQIGPLTDFSKLVTLGRQFEAQYLKL